MMSKLITSRNLTEKGTKMKKFKVEGFEKIYYSRLIEAETEEEACNQAFADVQENHWTFWDEQDGDIEVFEAIEVTGDE